FFAIKVFLGVANLKGIEKIAKKIFETYPSPILELILEKQSSLWKITTIAVGRISSLSDIEHTIFANALNKFSSKVWH
ncbi:RimK-like ATPgrasp N-terminal domain-containing protein, partial [Francisella tularensis subsp. holarctica]|uniref:RimK-like ATPgrasp N-terminal domain-containing protein n=1 Tax=Francisella tularensis TaxID=263 RepID=UPI002381C860